jgi:hypothetical protein
MIQYKYKHLWKKYIGFLPFHSLHLDRYICEKYNLIEIYSNITQFLPNCKISDDECLIKQIIE